MELLESNLSDGKIELLDLPEELIPQYALSLNLGQINNLCLTSKKFNQLICANEHFWKMKFIHDYNFTPNYSGSWKRLYQNYKSTWVFGSNNRGRLGLGDTENRLIPTQIPNLLLKEVAAGAFFSAVIDLQNNVLTFGRSIDQGDQLTPTKIPGVKAKSISAKGFHTVFIDLDDNVWTFGRNNDGQLGLGDQEDRSTPVLIPGVKAKAVSAGGEHTVLIDLDDNVWAFGLNRQGQLGLGDQLNRSTPTLIPGPVSSTGARLPFKAKAISAGNFYSVLIDLDDNVWTFGDNWLRQLGLGDNLNRNIPTPIGLKAKAVAAGGFHTVLIDLNDNVWTFGSNNSGQLGLGDNQIRLIPAQIPEFKAKSIFAGSNRTFCIDPDDNIWGFGQIGLEDEDHQTPNPTMLPALKGTMIATGLSHTIAIATPIVN